MWRGAKVCRSTEFLFRVITVLGLAVGLSFLLFAGSGAAWAQGGEAGAPPPPIDESDVLFVLFDHGGSLKTGTVGLCEGPLSASKTCGTKLSDILTFQFSDGVATARFASDRPEPGEINAEPADAPQLTENPPATIDKFVEEKANANGVERIDYIPTQEEPGAQFDTTGTFIAGVSYSITSDPSGSDLSAVPEPSTIALVAAGLCPLALGYLRARARGIRELHA